MNNFIIKFKVSLISIFAIAIIVASVVVSQGVAFASQTDASASSENVDASAIANVSVVTSSPASSTTEHVYVDVSASTTNTNTGTTHAEAHATVEVHSESVEAIKDMFHDFNTAKPEVKIIATAIVCDDESKLPNWGLGGPDITSHTATDYVASHTGCTFSSDWNFQWGFSGVNDLSGNFVGEADGSKGVNTDTGSGLLDWKTFGPSNTNGVAMTTICDLQSTSKIWVREVLKDGYVPFSYDPSHQSNENNVSAELYCHLDVNNYDNYDFISAPQLGHSYHCVAFNVRKPIAHTNQAPVITVVGSNPMIVTVGGAFVDPRATVLDAEDGDITNKLVATGTVNVNTIGTYTITYNATDTQNLAAVQKTRTVTVVPKPVCTTNCAVNHPPVITVIGANPLSIVQHTAFTDPGATAFDLEDGTITPRATGTVNTDVVGAYAIIYTAIDSQGATATPAVRTVNVIQGNGGCTTNCTASNTAPVITIIGANPQLITLNSVFTDLGATAFDLEDGTITPRATGTVNTGVLGSYAITYNATDSKNLAATPKVRTVTVVPVGTSINQKPEITLLGDIIMQLTVGTAFVDPRATVLDAEDGDITSKLVATGTVNVNTIGTYTITYNATDTQNLAADQKTRTVNIVSAPTTGCTTNCGGGGSTGGSATFDYYGCINPSATNYNRLANKDDGSCVYQGGSTGGGGGGSVPLTISNEKLVVTGTTSVTVTWSTNLPSDSRVVYGMNSVASLGVKPFYGYQLTTATDTTNVYNHSMLISGIPSAIATYFRPVSSLNAEIVTGIELTRTPVTTSIGGNPLACEYLKEYLRIGVNNNPTEVTKLQLFLKNYEGATNLAVTGFFDTTTDTAVRSFQDKYKRDVLDTWNLPSNTGYVYYTTKKKINEIYCQREFPLTIEQKNEITSFRALIERINASGRVGDTTLLPIVGANKVQGSVAGVATVKTPVMITVTPSKENNTTAVNTDSDNSVEERGRIAIADLLATAPSIAEDVAGRADTHMSPEIGTDTDMNSIAKKSLLASAMSAISFRMNQCSPTTIYGTLIFLILALIFAVLYVRKQEEVKESDTAIVVETKP